MTKAEALQNFWAGFGIDAYPSTSVPVSEKTLCPYLTYEQIIGNWNTGQPVYPTVNIYYRTDSEAVINAKADEIAKTIGSGTTVRCDDGLIVIHFTSAWQPINDGTDPAVKRRYTTVQIDFCTL